MMSDCIIICIIMSSDGSGGVTVLICSDSDGDGYCREAINENIKFYLN